jgi:hypothetical protein
VNEKTRAVLVIASLLLLGVLGYVLFLHPFFAEQREVDKVLTARSTWTVTMQQYLHSGPLSAQTYRISNDDGKITMFYSGTNRDGTVTKQFDVPLTGPQATFLFEALRAAGIWELPDKAMRPHAKDEYVIYVGQTLGNEGGHRAFGFSDPVFWAMTKGLEFPVNMKNPNLPIGITSRPLREPRYLKIVELFESFGPPSVQQAEAKIRAELVATNDHQVGASKAGR